ncbi:EAL domain-containing protein [Pseudohongiella acticola]|jgi:multidomain signaling protein FimX|uniref:EAL domain-containing protein n=1 Tax=Pseudohongiella acticola TaxID=1524254 RepID=UPI0030EC0E35
MDLTVTHNILVNHCPSGKADKIIGLLRRAGLGVRVREFEGNHLPDCVPGCDSHDLILLFADVPGQANETLLRQLQSSRRDIPCLLICRAPARWLPLLNLGAAGLINDTLLDSAAGQVEFVYRIKRELEQLKLRREARRANSSLRELHQRLQSFMDATSEAIACLQDGLHQYANQGWLTFFGFPSQAALHAVPFMDLVADEDLEKVRDFLRHRLDAGQQRCEFTALRRDGSEIRATLDSSAITINGDNSLQVLIQPAKGNSVHHNAISAARSKDLQSGLLNESGLERLLNQAISSAVYQGRFSAVIMLSAANLSDIAVVLGRTDMYLLLSEIASLLASACPTQAVLGRLDAGDFIVLMPDADTESCQQLLARLDNQRNLLAGLAPDGTELQFSIGAAMITDEAPDVDTLLIRARQHQTLRQYQHANASSAGETGATMTLLRQALSEDSLLLVYQPTVSLKVDASEYYEVRVRLPMADRIIYPGEFLDAANQHGYGERIDRYVISHALRAIAGHNNAKLRLTINLTPNSLLSQTLLVWLTQELRRHKQSPRQLILQISEMDVVSAPVEARRFCLQVRELGFELALTHFGCSLDPFRVLGQVQADYVKLDRSLLHQIELDADQRERLHDVVSTLHAQGVRVIAPMVEDIEVLPLLWQCNVNFVQGNCLQQPEQSMEFGLFKTEEISLDSVG